MARVVKLPKYGLHQGSGQAVMYVQRKPVYLGVFGSPESRAEYDRRCKALLQGDLKTAAAEVAVEKSDKPPDYCCHPGNNRAYVRFGDTFVYLGEYGTPESKARYERLIAEWLGNNRVLPAKYRGTEGKLVRMAVAEYVASIQAEYENVQKPTEPTVIRYAVKPLVELYGDTPIADFDNAALKAVRRLMIKNGWVRKSINKQMQRVRNFFAWASEQGYIDDNRVARMRRVKGLRKGKSPAKESKKVRAVDPKYVQAVWDFLPSQVQAMITVQEMSGCRPGEVCIMRMVDIDTTDPECWIYTPEKSKMDHLEDADDTPRIICLNRVAQKAIEPFMTNRAVHEYLFSAKEATAEMLAKRRANRKTPLYPSHVRRYEYQAKANPQRAPGDRYKTASYRVAIKRACDKADLAAHKQHPGLPWDGKQVRIIPRWKPNQLRHLAGTIIRKQFGLEAAKVHLGHRNISATQIYAEISQEKARELAKSIAG